MLGRVKKLSLVFMLLLLLPVLGTVRADTTTISLGEIRVEIEHQGSVDPGGEMRINITVQSLDGAVEVNSLQVTLQQLLMDRTAWEHRLDVLESQIVGEALTRMEYVVTLPSTLSPGHLLARVSVDYGPDEIVDEDTNTYLSFVESSFRGLYEELDFDHRRLQMQYALLLGDYDSIGSYNAFLEAQNEALQNEIAIVGEASDRLNARMSTTLESYLLGSFPLDLPIIEYALLVAVVVLAVALAVLLRRRGSVAEPLGR
ncbi:MAG: hypothetical protein ACE5IJ_02510 [Thermoplasmata archaeon]